LCAHETAKPSDALKMRWIKHTIASGAFGMFGDGLPGMADAHTPIRLGKTLDATRRNELP
jgi:hypothetical protein